MKKKNKKSAIDPASHSAGKSSSGLPTKKSGSVNPDENIPENENKPEENVKAIPIGIPVSNEEYLRLKEKSKKLDPGKKE